MKKIMLTLPLYLPITGRVRKPTPIIEDTRVSIEPLKLPDLIGPNHLCMNGLSLCLGGIFFVPDLFFTRKKIEVFKFKVRPFLQKFYSKVDPMSGFLDAFFGYCI